MNKRVQQEIDALLTIERWAKSCKTSEQLNNVKSFLNKRTKTVGGFLTDEVIRLNYELGIVDGIILSIEKLKFKMTVVTPYFLNKVKYDELNNLELRSDFENDNIGWSREYITKLSFEGYVGNRPEDFDGEYHEDDTWAIDLQQNGQTVESYLYSSKYEYLQDITILQQ